MLFASKTKMVEPEKALKGRPVAAPHPEDPLRPRHPAAGPRSPTTWKPPWSAWAVTGAPSARFWQTPGVYTTAVGYAGGFTPNPTYNEVCSAKTGHTEAVLVVFDPEQVSYEEILKTFWERHDPTQGMRQGNDVGTQYRSAIYTTTPEQAEVAAATKAAFEERLKAAGYGAITTEIAPLDTFYYESDDIHQQYLAKVPNGYCGLGGTGVSAARSVSAPRSPWHASLARSRPPWRAQLRLARWPKRLLV